MNVVELEVRQFRGSAPGGVEQFEQGPISPPERVAVRRALEQRVDLLGAKHVRHPFPELLAAEQLGPILLQNAFELQIAEDRP